MIRIGLISDTHGQCDQRFFDFFKDVDELWHAGDIGTLELLEEFEAFKPTRAVWGNIDNHKVRAACPEHQRFTVEGLEVWITHIGGYPGRYDKRVREEMYANPPGMFITGHSHILKVMPDKKLNLLHINPGAAGLSGFHKKRTAIRFSIVDGKPTDMEILELDRWK
jgi:putative phosphoesterase